MHGYKHFGIYLNVFIAKRVIRNGGQVAKFNPLKNVRTSMTFLELLDKPRGVTEIALILKIKPSSVFEHLVRLRRINIVLIGKRRGKFQEYEIDWNRFCDLFLREAPRSTQRKINMRRELNGNIAFNTLVKEYLKEIRLLKNITLYRAMNEFEEGLIRIFPRIKVRETSTNDKKLMVQALEKWYNNAKHSFTLPQNALYSAFEKTGLVDSQG